MKACRGSTAVAPLILGPGAKWWRVVNTTPRPLYPRERTPVPVEQETGWAPNLVWRREIFLNPAGIWTPDRPARSPATMLTMLSQLLSLTRISYIISQWNYFIIQQSGVCVCVCVYIYIYIYIKQITELGLTFTWNTIKYGAFWWNTWTNND
jgi:hypothetical protein